MFLFPFLLPIAFLSVSLCYLPLSHTVSINRVFLYTAQAGFRLRSLLPQPPEYRDGRCIPCHQAFLAPLLTFQCTSLGASPSFHFKGVINTRDIVQRCLPLL